MHIKTLFSLITLLMASAVGTAAYADETAARQCAGNWASAGGELTLDVWEEGEPIIIHIEDGVGWGSIHNTVLMRFKNRTYVLDKSTVFVRDGDDLRETLANYIGSVEAVVMGHEGTLFAIRTRHGVFLASAGYDAEGYLVCAENLVLRFDEAPSS